MFTIDPSIVLAVRVWTKTPYVAQFISDQKMSEIEVTFFSSILMGLCFLTFFDTSKTERGKTFPSFSDKPHDIVWQYHVGKGQGETGITILLQTTRMAVKMTMCVPVTYPPYT